MLSCNARYLTDKIRKRVLPQNVNSPIIHRCTWMLRQFVILEYKSLCGTVNVWRVYVVYNNIKYVKRNKINVFINCINLSIEFLRNSEPWIRLENCYSGTRWEMAVLDLWGRERLFLRLLNYCFLTISVYQIWMTRRNVLYHSSSWHSAGK